MRAPNHRRGRRAPKQRNKHQMLLKARTNPVLVYSCKLSSFVCKTFTELDWFQDCDAPRPSFIFILFYFLIFMFSANFTCDWFPWYYVLNMRMCNICSVPLLLCSSFAIICKRILYFNFFFIFYILDFDVRILRLVFKAFIIMSYCRKNNIWSYYVLGLI